MKGDFAFVQISDSHIGFDKAANPDVTATLQQAIAKITGLAAAPDFVLHTGDLRQRPKPSEFDTLDQSLRSVRTDRIFFVPGEHDVLNDHKGGHFIGLVNVMNLKAAGLGRLGVEQLAWLKQDLKHLKHSTPIVLFAHILYWSEYPQWGRGADDSEQALGLVKRFGSVSVLN